MANKKNSVAKTNRVHTAMAVGLARIMALVGGTTTMREAGESYLPRNPAEEAGFYKNRLARTTLFNAFKKTLGVHAGKVFNNGLQFKDPVPDAIAGWIEDIDLEGNDLDSFAYEFFKRGEANGVDYVLIDIPRPQARTDGKPLTLGQEKEQNIRPYLVPVLAENLLGWKSTNINGVQTLSQIRIAEVVTEAVAGDEFAEIDIQQIRVIDIGLVRIFRENKKSKEWVIHEEFETSINFIPLVPFYAGKKGFLHGESPLMDLAHLNIEHWQQSSDLANILHLIQVPILVATGVAEDMKIKVGPNTLVKFPDTESKLGYVEPAGHGTKLGMESLSSIKEEMAVMGASMLVDKPGTRTATEKAINEGGSNSDLGAIAQNFEDTINTALIFMFRIAGMDETSAPEVQVNTDFGVAGKGAITVDQLLKIRATGEISSATFLSRLNELTGFDIDAEEEITKLSLEGPSNNLTGGLNNEVLPQ